ncbi:MAG: hypothetical protein HY403_11495 [Elusimicrobia bacterium]|nr:hypothetical protein [Elusimicrobiota bacterium]
MNPLTIPMIVKTSQPVLTAVLLGVIGALIGCVLYWMLRHEHRTRKARKHGHSPHTGHHGNH